MFAKLNNGVKMPKLGVGTYRLRGQEVEGIVRSAIDKGYRLFDTARIYYNEAFVGKALREKMSDGSVTREELFVTSKLGPDDLGAQKTRIAAAASLQALGLEFLDLYLIHWPGVSGERSDSAMHSKLRKESWQELEKMYNEGMFRAIGVSNYTVKHLEELKSYCNIEPAVLQVEIHPYLTQTELREYCFISGIHVQAYSSLGSNDGAEELLQDKVVTKIASEITRSPAQVLLRWAVQQGLSIIPKTRDPERLAENSQVYEFELSEEHIDLLNSLDEKKHYCWDAENIK